MILDVHIVDPTATTPERTLRFSKSPVRIGRNQLNDISLHDPFVSEWHGIIRFDDGGVAYFDLGSTNGTMLNRQRLVKNVPAALSRESKLQLGRLTLTVSREQQREQQKDGGPHKTLGWDPSVSSLPEARGIRGPVVSPAADSQPGGHRPTNVGHSAADMLAPARQHLTPPPISAAGATPIGSSGGKSSPIAPSQEGTLEARYATILEAFSEAFVGLRKGYEQFGTEVGIRIVNGASPLHRARTSREVLDYVLSPSVDPTIAARDLIGIFADLAIHNIAMMEAITEGARALLQALDPRANEVETGPRLLASAKTKQLWKSYLERFEQMITEDEPLHAAIFGDEFARAYASVTLGDANQPDPKGRR